MAQGLKTVVQPGGPIQEVPHFINEAAKRKYAKLPSDLPPPLRRREASKLVKMVPIFRGLDNRTFKAQMSKSWKEKAMDVAPNEPVNESPAASIPLNTPEHVVTYLRDKKEAGFTATQFARETGTDSETVPQKTGRTDKLLQKLKKAGLISNRRVGRDSIWSVTDEGARILGTS